MDLTDVLTRFLLPTAGVRGVHVRLDQSWKDILKHADYPEYPQQLLGQSCVAAALFTAHIKVEGRLSIQLRSESALRALFAECTADGAIRGIVQFHSENTVATLLPKKLNELGSDALLAITIENPGLNPDEPMRYQSFVGLNADSLNESFERYFDQSEQLPTRLLLVADGHNAAGVLLQKLPTDEGDEDGWQRINALFDTLSNEELLELPADTLVHRLFHEESPELVAEKTLRFECSCSRERVTNVLLTLGQQEALQIAKENGDSVDIHCEFCGQHYQFIESQIIDLFAETILTSEAPQRLQ